MARHRSQVGTLASIPGSRSGLSDSLETLVTSARAVTLDHIRLPGPGARILILDTELAFSSSTV